MRLWRFFLLVVIGLVPHLGQTQGLLWSQRLDIDETTMTRASNGDIYTAGILYQPSVIPVVSCYSASGVLKSRTIGGSWAVPSAKVVSARMFGSTLYFVVSFGTSFSRIFKFNTDTQNLTSTLLQSAGSEQIVSGLSVTLGNYCVVGRRLSDNAGVIQVRSQSDDSILREVTTTHSLSTTFTTSGFHFAIGTYSSSGQYRVVVHRVSSTANTSRSALAPAVSSNFLTTPLKGVMTSNGVLYLVSNYYNGVTTFNLFVIPFLTATLAFANSWEESASQTESYVRAYSALGSSGLFLAMHNRYIGIGNDGSLVFESSYPNFASTFVTTGAAVTDDFGNAVCLLGTTGESWLYRFSPSGLLLNSTTMGVTPATIGEARIDSAGVVRFLYEGSYQLSDWRLGAVSQASLNLPGSYTVGGAQRVGTISIGGPAPAGGATFDLFSNNVAAVVPPTVTIPTGQTSVNFTITTSAVAANTKPTINARYDGIVLQSNFDLAAPLIQQVMATPQSQYGGVNITGSVTLTGPAPAGGKTVTLTSSNTSRVTVPASVVVPAGAASANFSISTSPTLVNASSVITATTGAVSRTVFVAVVAPVFQSATLASNSIKGGTSTTMTLTIGTPAPSGYTITLVSGASSFVQLPSSFAVPAGNTTVNVPVLTSPVTSTVAISLVAYRGPYIKTMTLTLTP